MIIVANVFYLVELLFSLLQEKSAMASLVYHFKYMFEFFNNIIHIFMYFFIYMYFKKMKKTV